MLRTSMLAVGALAAVLVSSGFRVEQAATPARPAGKICSYAASPQGSDRAPGTLARPYRTAQRLVERLRPGDTGCLVGGTYDEDVTITRGGSPGVPVTLRSAPGNRATLRGVLYVSDSANDVVVSFLRLDGSTTEGAPSPQVNGDRVAFRSNEVTNRNTAICFAVGGAFERYGRAVGTVIDRNRIHHCGRLPATNHDHGIYLEGSRSARVTNNILHGNADWGIHLYPDADQSYVAGNIVAGNGGGIIVAGEAAGGEYRSSHSSDRNLIERNVVSDSLLYHNVETYWGGPTGTGNLLRRNCLWKARRGNFGDLSGLAARENVVADPKFASSPGGDFTLGRASRCARMGAGPSR